MKILFDARNIRTDFHDGISRYTTELGNALATLASVTFVICDKAQLKFLPHDCNYRLIHSQISFLEPFTALILNRFKPDVVFSPMQTMGSFGRKYKLLLTLHDMIYYHYRKPPTNLSAPIRAGWWLFHSSYTPQRLLLNGADEVVTVSETSRQEIIANKLTKRPVAVVPNAPNDMRQFLNKDVNNSIVPENLIYMGTFMPYKNVETLIKGMEYLPNHTLHLLSKISPERKAELQKMVGDNSKVIFYGGVSDEKYAELLADKALHVNGSHVEGFGIPIAEAMTLGVPSVLSDTPIFREIGGEAALYFQADDVDDFVAKVKKASELKVYKELSDISKEIRKKFSWVESAKILLKTMQDLSSKK